MNKGLSGGVFGMVASVMDSSGDAAAAVSSLPTDGRGETVETVRARVRRLFRKSETDDVTRAFFEMVLQHRLEKLK